MPRTLHQLENDLEPTLTSGDNAAVDALLEELTAHCDRNPQEVEALVGWAVLVGSESRLPAAGKYGIWFMDKFPESVLPVKIEYAKFLAEDGEYDEATDLAREYLRLIDDSGHLARIEQFSNVRAGASRAFLLLTAAYTEAGARSYSRRVLQYAARYPLHEAFLNQYQVELGRLDEELADPENRRLDTMWEEFFADGSHADALYEHCNKCGCPLLARRVDLLAGNFSFRPDYRVDEDELLQLVLDVERVADACPAQMLG